MRLSTKRLLPYLLLVALLPAAAAPLLASAATPADDALAPAPLSGDVRDPRLPLDLGRQTAPSAGAPGYYQLSEFMAGSVAVGIILPESTGAASTENWDAGRLDEVVGEIRDGLDWWQQRNPGGDLDFIYDVHYQVPTSYEPIKRASTEDNLWINQTLAAIGYDGDYWQYQAYDYLNSLRTTYGTDWAVVIFVVDSLKDYDGQFTDGYFAYTYGMSLPLVVMTYDNDGWGASRMASVLAHEFSHDFGAADEYCLPGYSCCSGGGNYGYLAIPNANCEAGCDLHPDPNGNGICDGDDAVPGSNCRDCAECAQAVCIMRTGGLESDACPFTLQQVGIRDSDGDGLIDPLDTEPSISADVLLEWVGGGPLTYTGAVSDVPYPAPLRPDVTINHITSVEFELDYDGVWQVGAAEDSTFDEASEAFLLALPALADGQHALAMRATNDRLNPSATFYDSFSVDSDAPEATLQVAGGAAMTGSDLISARLAVSDVGSGVYEMLLSNEPSFAGKAWEPFSLDRLWSLEGEDGQKTVYAKVRDRAHNESPTCTASLLLDQQPPSGSLTLAEGAYVTDRRITLSLVASDGGSGLSGVRFSADSVTWTDWEPYVTERSWLLDDSDGRKGLYAQVSDVVGNLAEFSATVTLDRGAPSSAVVVLPSLSSPVFTVSWTGEDLSGITGYDVQWRKSQEPDNGGQDAGWQDWLLDTTETSAVFVGEEGATYYFRVRARDLLGNLEPWPDSSAGDTTTYAAHRTFVVPVWAR